MSCQSHAILRWVRSLHEDVRGASVLEYLLVSIAAVIPFAFAAPTAQRMLILFAQRAMAVLSSPL